MNSSGSIATERRVVPPQQGLDADDAEVGEPVDRLVHERELIVVEGRAKVELELDAPASHPSASPRSNISARSLPAALAWCSATSASRRRSPPTAGSPTAMPALAVIVSGASPSRSNGWRMTSSSRPATSSGAGLSGRRRRAAPRTRHRPSGRRSPTSRSIDVSRSATAIEQLVAGVVAERVVDVPEVVEIDEHGRARRAGAVGPARAPARAGRRSGPGSAGRSACRAAPGDAARRCARRRRAAPGPGSTARTTTSPTRTTVTAMPASSTARRQGRPSPHHRRRGRCSASSSRPAARPSATSAVPTVSTATV